MKASARQILTEAESWVPAYAKGDQDLWTVKLVKEALVDAFRLLRSTAGRVGPRGMIAAWPEFANNPEDYAPRETKTSPYHTRMTVTRMEMVLLGWKDESGVEHAAWLRGALDGYPELKEKLEAWVFAELREEATTELCERKKWSLATFKRHRDRAAGLVAQRLNSAALSLW